MYKLWATLVKDFRVLSRDKIGLTFMFGMPIILVIVITSLQASTFELVNDNKLEMIICNNDGHALSKELIQAISKSEMFKIHLIANESSVTKLSAMMDEKDVLVTLIIPKNFSAEMDSRAQLIATKALSDENENQAEQAPVTAVGESVKMMYQPVLQKSYLQSVNGALSAALQLVENKQIINTIYSSLNNKKVSDNLEQEILSNRIPIDAFPASKNGNRIIPNATQHNVPAWTIFAMFFVVTSLGSSIVKEKLSGSFVRLKTLPTSYLLSIASKQITYVGVCLLQVLVIFSLGVFLFPHIGLPKLNLPANLGSLFIVSFFCGWCAVSYAICIGVFAQSQEQANGFGAVSIVILAALGGVLVPSFAMPHSFQWLINASPLHWCLESYYDLFLEGGNFNDIFKNVSVILAFTICMQVLTIIKLKKNNII